MPRCIFCDKEIDVEKPGRQEYCPFCNNSLHCCMQCRFYDETYHNSCREPQAERIVDKEKSNFCDYFSFGRDKSAGIKKDSTLGDLESLFRKG